MSRIAIPPRPDEAGLASVPCPADGTQAEHRGGLTPGAVWIAIQAIFIVIQGILSRSRGNVSN
jgi:hypothetical protein